MSHFTVAVCVPLPCISLGKSFPRSSASGRVAPGVEPPAWSHCHAPQQWHTQSHAHGHGAAGSRVYVRQQSCPFSIPQVQTGEKTKNLPHKTKKNRRLREKKKLSPVKSFSFDLCNVILKPSLNKNRARLLREQCHRTGWLAASFKSLSL